MNETGFDGVQGVLGWGYIWSAYGIVYGGLVIYTLSLLRRLHDLKLKRDRGIGQADHTRLSE